MSQHDLAATIDAAWEDRANVTPATKGAVARSRRGGADGCSIPARRASPRKSTATGRSTNG